MADYDLRMTMSKHTPFFWILPFLLLVPGLALARGPILILGDSLSAAYGIDPSQGWVQLLDRRTPGIQVVNASISGETTAGGRARLPALLDRHRPTWLILELGANDGLRGLSLQAMEANLKAMIDQARKAGGRVLLIGMRIPPNYGPSYTRRFHEVYRRLAEDYGLPWAPFLLEGVATLPELMQADGLHPRAPAQERILENVWAVLGPLLEKAGTDAAKGAERHEPGCNPGDPSRTSRIHRGSIPGPKGTGRTRWLRDQDSSGCPRATPPAPATGPWHRPPEAGESPRRDHRPPKTTPGPSP